MSSMFWIVLTQLSGLGFAGERWLQNDDFEDGDVATFMGGFVADECWASIYEPEPGDYPFQLKYIDMLVGGGSSSHMFIAEFYGLDGTDMTTASLLGEEAFSLTGSSSAWNRLTISDLDLGMSPVDAGNIAVSICHFEHDAYPSIAVDTSRDAGDLTFISGDIGLGTDWYTTDLLAMFGLDVGGDWIMRACIQGASIDGSCDDADADATIDQFDHHNTFMTCSWSDSTWRGNGSDELSRINKIKR